MLGCMSTRTDSRMREMTAPVSSALVRPHVNTVLGLGLHTRLYRLLAMSYNFKVHPALSEEKGGVGGERTR